MRITLKVTQGAAKGRTQLLRVPCVLTVGRTEQSDFSIPADASLSSLHFKLSCDQHGCRVVDLNSTNGTFVGGQRIESADVVSGDEVTAGESVFQIVMQQRRTKSFDASRLPESKTTASPDDSKPLAVETVLRQTHPVATPDSTRTPSTPRKSRGAAIEIISDHMQGRKSLLRPGQSLTVGRTDRSDFVISDPSMSAQHFSISSAGTGWQLKDLGSTAGTRVNGVAVSVTTLASGDTVQAGQTRFAVQLGGTAPIGRQAAPTGSYPFQEALEDADREVRRAALDAAALSGQPWLLDHCRNVAKNPTPDQFDTLYMLAVLGGPSERNVLVEVAGCETLGPSRLELLGSFGDPATVPILIKAMKSEDVRSAIAAATAFSKITGVSVESTNRATVPPADGDEADEFDQEFLDQVNLPDTAKAEHHWRGLESQFLAGRRYQGGVDVSQHVSPELLSQLDMQSRWEIALRDAFAGKRSVGKAAFEQMIPMN
ncbi:FHA domain-containing protein [Stieleria sp. TO1_6]|uniref:FHA domain-containing protein n=1 Tax=Stieleria tagensis TaxID=2956795 RepID=UPI00209B17CC|nr:FHA domain-containing protein [Stieleria tagensis]MCO8121115.1 FHA domain-containing protein [Stieleria tagensis]